MFTFGCLLIAQSDICSELAPQSCQSWMTLPIAERSCKRYQRQHKMPIDQVSTWIVWHHVLPESAFHIKSALIYWKTMCCQVAWLIPVRAVLKVIIKSIWCVTTACIVSVQMCCISHSVHNFHNCVYFIIKNLQH